MTSEDELSSLLATLSPEEQSIIRPVLERDLEFQRREKDRILSIKAEVNEGGKREGKISKESQYLGLTVPQYRGTPSSGGSSGGESFGSQASISSSALSPISPLGSRSCNDCGAKLGIVFNSGVRCIRCDSLLCELCRVFACTNRKEAAYCKKCYRHREVLAASGEWMGLEGEGETSAIILTKLRRESEYQGRRSEQIQMRTRNLSLPPISASNLLGIPNEERRSQSEVGDKYWQGSPSPRSPNQLGICDTKESIGSPSPRVLTPNSQAYHFIPHGIEDETQEGIDIYPSIDNSRDRRLSWSNQTKNSRFGRRTENSNEYEKEVKMRRNPMEIEDQSNSPRSSTQSEYQRKGCSSISSSLSFRDQDSISIASFSSIDGGTNCLSSVTSSNGEIILRLVYAVHSASLIISILSSSNLPNLEGGIKPNPYVKILLMRKGSIEATIKHKTRSRRNTNEPTFNYEINLPNITKSELEQHILRLTVCHRDLLQNSTIIGYVNLPLNSYPWHLDKCRFSLLGKSETPPDPTPSSLRKIRVITTFSVVDRERKIGTLTVRLQSITFHSSDTKLGSVVVCGKLFVSGRRVSREQSGRINIPHINPGNETEVEHSLVFRNVNLNDLHLHMLVLTLWEQNGLMMSSRSLGQIIINHVVHRRNIQYPARCSCPLCSPWYRLIDDFSLAISFAVSLSTTTLDDSAIALA
ncbi:hypothetical protein PFISCL1PPCAC_20038 [Pristionchus fissidentatus]|uniref:Uncharacterized protein n=1 Tax=Pristionchus fissidentatus TaxID=1538716 RepID=A0AAV5W929_9BILA|nr:hypothetical protein PFISCL1PPCAC_20038 [Pristionchus fissidentatus]